MFNVIVRIRKVDATDSWCDRFYVYSNRCGVSVSAAARRKARRGFEVDSAKASARDLGVRDSERLW